MEDIKAKLHRMMKKCFEGEVTLTKVDLWFIIIICMLAGIVYGLRKAPMTHGMTIGSYNGNACSRGGCRKKTESGKQEEEGNEADMACGKNRKKRRCRCHGKG